MSSKLAENAENRFVVLGQFLFAEANELVVETHEDVAKANELLKRTTAAEKEIEEARTDMVKPLNDQVKQINALAKQVSAPVEEAKLTVKEKILAFNRKQEEIRLEKERKIRAVVSVLDSITERGQLLNAVSPEDVANEPTVLLAYERAKARVEESERLAAEKVRQAEENARIEKARAEQSAEMAAIAEKEAAVAAERRRLEDERAQFERDKRAAELERLELENRKAGVQSFPPVKGIRRTLKATVKDADLVPRAYCSPDESKIREAVKNGLREIPGVLIEVVESIQ